MELEITGPFKRLSTEDLEIIDDVVQSFCESMDVVLKTNFKAQRRDAGNIDSVARALGGNQGPKAEGITKNQKIAAVFCRQWLAGVVSELTHKLVDDTSDRFNYETTAKMMSPRMLEEGADAASADDIGVCVENARICGNGQIEVNYDLDPSEVPPNLKPKLKTQELTQLILQGKETEHELVQKLERFWSDAPAMLLHHLSQEDSDIEEVDGATSHKRQDDDGAASGSGSGSAEAAARRSHNYSFGAQSGADGGGTSQLPIDDRAIELLENIAKGAAAMKAPDAASDDSVQKKLAHLAEKARELGVQGMDTYISLYNKVNKEISNVNNMARFFAKLATDLTTAQQGQMEIM